MAVNITYETLFEILMREKGREELQKLDDNFFRNLRDYIKEKNKVISTPTLNVFSEEKDRTARQVQNIYRMVRELYERREKKIINMALVRSRTASDVIDTSSLLGEESALFESLVHQLDSHRGVILGNVTKIEPEEEPPAPEKEEPKHEQKQCPETTMVRFLHAVPKFVGRELEVYGPFGEEDIASLPTEMAQILVQKGRAEIISGQ